MAASGRPGPVVVDIPKDIQFASGAYARPNAFPHQGYRPKIHGDIERIREAVALMAAAKRPVFYTGGGVINSGPEATRLLRELRTGSADPLAQLTPRETDVLKGLAQGRSNREIARALSVSEETVKSHVSSILAKLGLADRTQAAIFALQRHLIPLEQALDPDGG